MSEEEAVSYTFMWHALSDACEKCRTLNGREWLDQDLFQGVLYDPVWGDVWNLDGDFSMAHGEHQFNCRCQLEVRVEVDYSQLEDYVVFAETITRMGRPVTVYREASTGRFVSGP